MSYERRPITPEIIDTLRINLSVYGQKLSRDPVCDFCGNQDIAWQYAARRMSTGEFRHCWRYAACEACANMVEHEAWESLIARCADRMVRKFHQPPRLADQAVRYAMRDLPYVLIRDQKIGEDNDDTSIHS